MKKIISILLIILLFSSIMCTNFTFASDDISGIKSAMKNVGSSPEGADNSSTVTLLNTVIGIIQLVGTGISLIIISLLGIKYLLASPSEKADVKKNIMPILIGCILLFAAVQIVRVVENFTHDTISVS